MNMKRFQEIRLNGFIKKRSCTKSYFGKNNPIADVFLSSDIARLIDLTEAGANYEILSVKCTQQCSIKILDRVDYESRIIMHIMIWKYQKFPMRI